MRKGLDKQVQNLSAGKCIGAQGRALDHHKKTYEWFHAAKNWAAVGDTR